MSIYKKLSAWLAVVMMTLISSCADDIKSPDNSVDADADAITFSLLTEGREHATRAISDASGVNYLYYAIYYNARKVGDEDDDYQLDDYYQPEGKIKQVSFNVNDPKSYVIRLIPDARPEAQNREYKIVCWAQYADKTVDLKNGITKANDYYDLSAFPFVKVNYNKDRDGNILEFPNNDENRDAFYASQKFSTSQKGGIIKVILTRPFAQINVGTSGWDYEGAASIEPDSQVITYSKIVIKGATDQLDMLNNKTVPVKKDELLDVTYDFAMIPAYRNLEKEDLPKLFGVYQYDHDGKKVRKYDDNNPENPEDGDDPADGDFEDNEEDHFEFIPGIFNKVNKGDIEEFLKLSFPDSERPRNPNGGSFNLSDFDKNKDGFADYISWSKYDTYCAESKSREELIYNIYTETFKYLSMCYVLVPFTTTFDEKGLEIGRSGTNVEIEFDCATSDEDGEVASEGIYNGTNVIELKNVPVCSNHRTNIIATDGSGFFMNSNELNVAIYSQTFADYYKDLEGDDSFWNQGGTNDDTLNDDYEWPGELNPEAGKTPLIMAGLKKFEFKIVEETDEGNQIKWIDWGNVASKYADMIRFMDDEIKIYFNLKVGMDRYSDVKDYINEDKLTYQYSIGGKNIDLDTDNNISLSGDNGVATFTMDELALILKENNIKPVTHMSNEYEVLYEPGTYNNYTNTYPHDGLYLRYYPVEFRVKTSFGEENNKFRSEDLVVTLRVYTSYKFTFHPSSTDEGKTIFNEIISNGKLGSTDTGSKLLDDEVNSYFIYNGDQVYSPHLKVKSRAGSGNNDKLYAITNSDIDDHIRLRGAHNNNEGHYVMLRNLRENCKIWAKIGRDKGTDNSDKGKENDPNDRNLYLSWDSKVKKIDTWESIDPTDRKYIGPQLSQPEGQGSKTTFTNSEAKVMGGEDTEIENFNGTTKEVMIYADGAAHSYFWIMISETDKELSE